MDNLVSVVMPSYHSERFIERTLLSALNQTYRDLEVLVIDNPSGDRTTEIIRSMACVDGRIRHLRPERNLGGAAQTRNYGITFARGRYLAFLDSDDTWVPEKLERQLNALRTSGAGMSYTGYAVVDEEGREVVARVRVPERSIYRDLLKSTFVATSTVVVDRSTVKRVFFPEDLPISEDYPAWLDVLKQCGHGVGLDAPLMRYRVVTGSLSSRKFKSASVVWSVLRDREGLALPDAAWCFVNYALSAILKNRRMRRI